MPLKLRRALVHAVKLIGFAVVVFIIIGGTLLVYEDDQVVRSDLAPAPSQVEIPDDLAFQVEEVTFQGGDDLTMAGWFTPPQNGATIILLHGYGGNRTAMMWHAQQLVEAGYGVLLYDERASGESEGQRRSFGWEDPVEVGGGRSRCKPRLFIQRSKRSGPMDPPSSVQPICLLPRIGLQR
jgi:pimeloyl-ACP methyl ester carboxylesterase